MREALAKLSKRDLAFVVAHSEYAANAKNPTDGDFAMILDVSRNTVMNRRKRIRSLGIPLYPFRGRGQPVPDDRQRSVEELKRDVVRLRRSAAEYARRADRIEAELATASVEVTSV